jgi:hypothetical protein
MFLSSCPSLTSLEENPAQSTTKAEIRAHLVHLTDFLMQLTAEGK